MICKQVDSHYFLVGEGRIRIIAVSLAIVFTKWDRFSRNTGDAYYMISQLLNLGITPQAIDQELDLNIPENKIILGVYLATSEAENARRSMNVKQGINRANKEGRWTARAPLGYKVHIMADHKRLLYPSEPQASLIRQAFALVLENNNTTQAIYHQLHCCPEKFYHKVSCLQESFSGTLTDSLGLL